MKQTRIVVGVLIGALLLTGTLPLQAAAKNTVKKPPKPISITADELYFSDKTGEMFARGNVVIAQDTSRVLADILRGNNKQTEIWVDGPMRYQEPLTDLQGMKLRYNYGAKFGVMRDLSGKCGDDYVSGKSAYIENGKYTLFEASATGCPVKPTPDYRVTARKVEIWPGDKMIAYDAKIWIKNTVLYSTPRYRRSLKVKDKEDEFPRFGYQDPDGFWISQRLNYAFNDTASAFVDLTYYTRSGFRPSFGIMDQRQDYRMQLVGGRYRDDNSNWISKEPEFRFELYPRPLGKLPIQYKFTASIGNWVDDVKNSWHQDYNVYLAHNPIYFDKQKTWRMHLGTGYQLINESYDASSQGVFRYNIGLSKELSPSFTAWTGYNFTGNTNAAFAYNKVDVSQEGIVGLAWKVNNRLSLSYAVSYDLANGRIYENYHTVKYNFHCWDTTFSYRSLKQELTWTVTVAKW